MHGAAGRGSPTRRLPDSTCETVVGLTPAMAATWVIVTRPRALRPGGVLFVVPVTPGPLVLRRPAVADSRWPTALTARAAGSYGSEDGGLKSIWIQEGARRGADLERFAIDTLLAPTTQEPLAPPQFLVQVPDLDDVPAHWHDYYELGYVLDGRRRPRRQRGARAIGPGSAFLLSPADFHELAVTGGRTLRCLNVVVVPGAGRGDAADRHPGRRRVAAVDRRPRGPRGRRAEDAGRGGATCTRLVCRRRGGHPARCWWSSRGAAAPPSAAPVPARGAGAPPCPARCAYVDRHFREPLTLAEVAAVAHLSPQLVQRAVPGRDRQLLPVLPQGAPAAVRPRALSAHRPGRHRRLPRGGVQRPLLLRPGLPLEVRRAAVVARVTRSRETSHRPVPQVTGTSRSAALGESLDNPEPRRRCFRAGKPNDLRASSVTATSIERGARSVSSRNVLRSRAHHRRRGGRRGPRCHAGRLRQRVVGQHQQGQGRGQVKDPTQPVTVTFESWVGQRPDHEEVRGRLPQAAPEHHHQVPERPGRQRRRRS